VNFGTATRLFSKNPFDHLPQINESSLVLPKIHLEPLAIGALDDGFDRRVYDPACVQIDLNAVADGVACTADNPPIGA
jgi:hypothetical protein